MKNKVIIIGAGLAGSLLGIYLARKQFKVEIYERRPDIRVSATDEGRSINLALSTRGIHALNETDVLDKVMQVAISMRGRLIHPIEGELAFQRYGKDEAEVIYATSRGDLNKTLMTAAEKYDNLRIHFNKRCIGVDVASGEVKFIDESTEQEEAVFAATIFAADGASSAVRAELIDRNIATFTQEYLEYGYKELTIPPGTNGRHRIEKNALHIWPRTTFMLIALPNLDGSFTCTFFFSSKGRESFESLDTEKKQARFLQGIFLMLSA